MPLHSFDRQQAGRQWSRPWTVDAPRRRTLSRTPNPYAHAGIDRLLVASCQSAVRMPECTLSGKESHTYSSARLLFSSAKINKKGESAKKIKVFNAAD